MARPVPTRIRLAVESLDLRPDARVLEVGAGTGVAAALLCRLVPEGHVTALERSGVAVAHAERRLAAWLEAGVADIVESDLTRFHGDGRPYDVVLAINVNVFWAGEAAQAVDRLAELVANDGVVHLWFEPRRGTDSDRAAGAARVGHDAVAALEAGGFEVATEVIENIAHVVGRVRPTGGADRGTQAS